MRYLNEYHLEKGYMLSFNFNKNKKPGVQELHFKNHTLVDECLQSTGSVDEKISHRRKFDIHNACILGYNIKIEIIKTGQ